MTTSTFFFSATFTPHLRLHRPYWLALAAITAFFSLLLTSLLYTASWADHLHPQRINWVSLELSPDQQTSLEQLDAQWESIYQRLQPQIEQDQSRLRELMESPSAQPAEVMQVQNRLQRNRHMLHQTATRIFMQKKHRLNPDQRQKLFMMMHPTSASR